MRKIDEEIRASRSPKGHGPSNLEGEYGDPGGCLFAEGCYATLSCKVYPDQIPSSEETNKYLGLVKD